MYIQDKIYLIDKFNFCQIFIFLQGVTLEIRTQKQQKTKPTINYITQATNMAAENPKNVLQTPDLTKSLEIF